MKKLHIAATCFLLSLFSCKEAKIEEKPKDDVIPVKIMTLEKKDQAQTYRLSGGLPPKTNQRFPLKMVALFAPFTSMKVTRFRNANCLPLWTKQK